MKKIIATALCLVISSPCFAAGRFDNYYPVQGYHNAPPPHYGQTYRYEKPKRTHTRISHRTKTIGAIAGIAGAALIISAIID